MSASGKSSEEPRFYGNWIARPFCVPMIRVYLRKKHERSWFSSFEIEDYAIYYTGVDISGIFYMDWNNFNLSSPNSVYTSTFYTVPTSTYFDDVSKLGQEGGFKLFNIMFLIIIRIPLQAFFKIIIKHNYRYSCVIINTIYNTWKMIQLQRMQSAHIIIILHHSQIVSNNTKFQMVYLIV